MEVTQRGCQSGQNILHIFENLYINLRIPQKDRFLDMLVYKGVHGLKHAIELFRQVLTKILSRDQKIY